MKRDKSVPTKEKIEKYIEELQASVGNTSKVEDVLENQEMLIAYLTQIGVNKDWLERAAVVEITKQKMKNILLIGKRINVSDKGIENGKSEMSVKDGVFYIYNVGKDSEYIKFEEAKAKENLSKEGEERFERATPNDEFIVFLEENEAGKVEKLIDRNGVVQFEKTYVRDVWGLLPKETYVRQKDSRKIDLARITEIEGEAIVNRSIEEDWGCVTTARPIANIDAIHMVKKYPAYYTWFKSKGFSMDTIIANIEAEHAENLKSLQKGYEEAESFKTFGKEFNKNEKTLGEFYSYLITLKPMAQKAFMSALIARRGKEDKTVKEISKKLVLASRGELEVQHDDLDLQRFDSMEDLNKAAQLRIKSKDDRLGKREKSEEESKFDFFRAREDIIQENWNAQRRINTHHYRVYHQNTEINAIKKAVSSIPFVGKRMVRNLNKEDIER